MDVSTKIVNFVTCGAEVPMLGHGHFGHTCIPLIVQFGNYLENVQNLVYIPFTFSMVII